MPGEIFNPSLDIHSRFTRRVYRPNPELQFSTRTRKSGSEASSLHGYIMEKFEESRKAKSVFEAVWLKNSHFVLGHQWIAWSNFTRSLYVPPAPPWRVRLTVNEILPAVNYHVANITKTRPIVSVKPKSSEEDDVNRARLSEKFLDYLWEKLDMRSKLVGLATRMVIHGSAFLQPYWDPDAGDPLTFEVSEEETEEIKPGDIGLDVFSAFEFFPDPVATCMDEVRYAIRARVLHVDTVREMYPRKADEIQPEGIRYGMLYQTRVRSIIGTEGFYSSTFQSEILPKSVLLREYMELPSRKYKKGRYAVITDNLVLASTTLEDVLGKSNYESLPFIKYDHFEVPDRFWGESLVSQLEPVQKEMNKTRSQEIEIRNLMSKPKILEPKGSGIPPTAFTMEPGERITYVEGKKPDFLWPQTPSNIYPQLVDTLRSDFNAVSQIFEVQRGAAPPPSLRTAAGIAYLQEQAQSMLAPRSTLFEANIVRLARKFLGFAKDFYIEERMISIVGDNDQVEVFAFYGGDINSFDVRIQPDSAFPRLKAVKQAQILELLQYGVLTMANNEDRRKILKLLELGDLDVRNDSEELNFKRSRFENYQMRNGVQIPVYPHENHEIHIEEHRRFMLTQDFYDMDDSIKAVFFQHLRAHEELQAQRARQNFQNMQQQILMQQLIRQQLKNTGVRQPGVGVRPVMPRRRTVRPSGMQRPPRPPEGSKLDQTRMRASVSVPEGEIARQLLMG